jgi:glucose/arabinose dehydrogenase
MPQSHPRGAACPRSRLGDRAAAVGAIVVTVALSACSGGPTSTGSVTAPVLSSSATATAPSSSTSSSTATSSAPSTSTRPVPSTPQVLATNLDVPWAIAFLPDGSALVTLRDRAQLLHLRAGSAPVSLGTIPGVVPGGEGGLLGVAVSPDYSRDHRVFVYYTAAGDNRVARLTFDGGRPSRPEPILTGIAKAGNHNGGRLDFGPDGFLYVTTGDAGEGSRSQSRSSLNGKILRITQDGKPAPGNPFGTAVWSMGHRNVQGMAWAPDGTMYASEFGQNTWDELNVIRPGRNYGWPEVEGRAGRSGFVDPLVQWPTDDASPSGIAYAGGAIYMAALRGESLWRIPVSGAHAGTPQRLLHGTYGRLREAVLAPDGRLWVLTSNTFRGTPGPRDDRVIAFPLAALR